MTALPKSALTPPLGYLRRRSIWKGQRENMSSVIEAAATAASVEGRGSPTNQILLDGVALLLARAELTKCDDGWITADQSHSSLELIPSATRQRAWRAEIKSLVHRWPDLRILLRDTPDYPAQLLTPGPAPAMLFVRGALDDARSLAVVGSRAASEQATTTAHEVGAALASAGATVVSGLARGVDTAAHTGALAAGGRSVAVVGTGIDVVFPPENAGLAGQLSQQGAVVSQFPPGLEPSKTSFPTRNAVIVGLSDASVIIDAEESSGTRIEMEFALAFSRPVLLWGPLLCKSDWARTLSAKHDGVHLVGSASEILALANHG